MGRRLSGSGLHGLCSNLKSIGTAWEMYATDFEGRYPQASLLAPDYLKATPTCPVNPGGYTFTDGQQP